MFFHFVQILRNHLQRYKMFAKEKSDTFAVALKTEIKV